MAKRGDSIQNFKAVIGEGWRPLNFNIKFPALYNMDGSATVTVQAASLPGFSHGVIMMYYKGKEIKIPGDKTYNDWTITFIIDKKQEIYKTMDLWSSAVYDDATGARGALSDLKKDIKVELLGDSGDVLSYHSYTVFPISFDEISADQTMTNQYGTFTMSFAVEEKSSVFTKENLDVNIAGVI